VFRIKNRVRGFTPTPKSLVSGFSLIEILIVISIIGILATITTVVLISNRQKARTNSGKAKASSVTGAIATCRNDGSPISSFPIPWVDNVKICATVDDTWPNLSQDGWEWVSITGNDSNDVAVSAKCEAKNCGNPQYALITVNGIIFSSSPLSTSLVTFTPIENTVTTANALFMAYSNNPATIIWTMSGQEITTISGTTIGLATCTRSGSAASTSSSIASIAAISSATAAVRRDVVLSSVSCSTFKPDVAKFNHTIQANVVGGDTRTWHWILNSPTPTPTIGITPTPTPTPPPPEE
jgi:prepilin-type N-terminal cleavage/methylation domain-containing protein